MSNTVSVSKDEQAQQPIPSVWRPTFASIVKCLKDGDYSLSANISGVPSLSEDQANAIRDNIEEYGAHLDYLLDQSWETSACQWMREYWDVLVDLFTIEEGASDLSLAARVYESDGSFTFEIQSVHVP